MKALTHSQTSFNLSFYARYHRDITHTVLSSISFQFFFATLKRDEKNPSNHLYRKKGILLRNLLHYKALFLDFFHEKFFLKSDSTFRQSNLMLRCYSFWMFYIYAHFMLKMFMLFLLCRKHQTYLILRRTKKKEFPTFSLRSFLVLSSTIICRMIFPR